MPDNSPNLEKDTDIQIQESQRVPVKIKRPKPRHIIIKPSKVKDRIIKSHKRTSYYILGNTLPLILSDFFNRNFAGQRE